MGKFLTGSVLNSAISKILAEPGNACAVAFWGRGSAERLPKSGQGEFRLVCNLTTGGTNPYAIEKLLRANVRHLPTLHAKVYLGSENAVIASANVSINGLGFEAVEQSKWLEAGIEVEKTLQHQRWFETLWRDAFPVDDADLAKAKLLWDSRPQRSLVSFSDFDPQSDRLPLLYWTGNEDWENNKKSVEEQMGVYDDFVEELINNSLEVDADSDVDALSPGRWLIVWQMGKSGRPLKRPKPNWFCTGRILRRTFKFTGEDRLRDSVLEADSKSSPPFDLDAKFLSSFYSVLDQAQFKPLWDIDDQGPWFSKDRIDLQKLFWKACKADYQMQLNTRQAM